MAMQSKIDIYNLLPADSIPKTLFISKEAAKNFDVSQIKNYPIVVKPNEGLKGLGVTFIHSASELSNYLQNTHLDIILQEKITGNTELGVFYCRYPNQENGFITGITQKKYMNVIGDGISTVRQLAKQNNRINRQLKSLEKICVKTLDSIPEKGKVVEILPIGSHTRGAEFINVTDKYKEAIYPLINNIASKIEGFYYGRFDIICNIDEATQKIIDFKIIELNGAMSEPIHIYDPKNSLFYAWRQIVKHWEIMSKIAYLNKDQKMKSVGFLNGLKLIAQNLKLESKLKNELYG
ncbi:MAG: hypothetical protein ACK4IK_00580 [Bacteroidia bacterium]